MGVRDACLAVLVALAWGISFVAIKVGVDVFPPLLFSALRFTLVAFPLVLFLPAPKCGIGTILTIGVVLGIVKFSFFFIAIHVGLSAGLASILLQAQVFFTIIFAAFVFGEHISLRQAIAIVVAALGIALVTLAVDIEGSRLGLWLILLAAFSWGVSNMFMRKVDSAEMLNLFVWISLIPPVPLFVMSYTFERAAWPQLTDLTMEAVFSLVYVSIVGTLLGFAAWGQLLAKYKAAVVAPFALLIPVSGMFASALLFGETFEGQQVLGTVLILAGLCLSVLSAGKGQQTQ